MIYSLDTETTGTDLRHGARPFLVTMCDENEEVVWWEWSVDPKTRKVKANREDFLEIIKLIDEADLLVLQNPKFDYTALYLLAFDLGLGKRFYMAWDWDKVRDTLIAGHLLASNQPHDLTTMALVYLRVNIQPFEDAIVEAANEARRIARSEFPDWRIAKKGLPEMPSAKDKVVKYDMWLPKLIAEKLKYPSDHPWWTVCSEYANSDSSVTLPLYNRQMELIAERGLMDIYLERLLILPVISRMEDFGISMDPYRLQELKSKFQLESEEAERTCFEIAEAYEYDLELPKSGVNNSLHKFVFETLKLPVIKTGDSGKPSLDKGVMDTYRFELEENSVQRSFIETLLGKRKRDTAISYLEGYERYMIKRRIHSSVNPTGTDTLRMSSSNPNNQNVGKQETGIESENFNIRYAFGPAVCREWYAIDYENLELKIPAYESGERIMIEIFEKPDDPPFFGSYHLLNASIAYPDLFWPIAEEKGKFKKLYAATWYQWIKNFGFAIQYGAQEATADKAAHRAGSFAAVKAKLINIEKLNQACIAHANKYGYVETIPDREINPHHGYPLLCRRSAWGSISPTLPLNYRVQGTACWIMMRAMIKVQKYIDQLNAMEPVNNHIHIAMNIHDELVLDFPRRDPRINLPKVRKIRNIMASIGECVSVPLSCGVTFHPNNWSVGVAV